MTEIFGRLEPFFETGTEGVVWSVADPSLPGYDGLWSLENGDHLFVMNDGVLWEGTIDLEFKRNWHSYPSNDGNNEYGQQAVLGYWVHGLQSNLDPEQWADMFFAKHRAVLTPGKKQRVRDVHPFHGPTIGMEDRLRSLSMKQQQELYRATSYSWLWFYSDNGWGSLAKDWGFTLDESIALFGSPTAEQIAAWKSYPKKHDDTFLPFDGATFTRLALLYGVYAGLDWLYDKDAIASWLNESHRKEMLLQPGIAGISAVRDMVYPISFILPNLP